MHSNGTPGDREAQTRAPLSTIAIILHAEKWVEEAAQNVVWNSRSEIADT